MYCSKCNTLHETLLAVAGACHTLFKGQAIPEDYEDYDGLHIDYEKQIVIMLNQAAKHSNKGASRKLIENYARKNIQDALN
jgi:hypothetical protein